MCRGLTGHAYLPAFHEASGIMRTIRAFMSIELLVHFMSAANLSRARQLCHRVE